MSGQGVGVIVEGGSAEGGLGVRGLVGGLEDGKTGAGDVLWQNLTMCMGHRQNI